ncbi:MAG: hypothetical protein OEV85_06575 [Candidatus Thorarchaeota archaeon]|nr:hypothetical protein [Candidatus Thorarchaeota archaeon]
MGARKVRVCPRCGSLKIKENKTSVNGWLVPTTYYCEEEGCGYSGPGLIEIDAEEAEILRQVMNGESSVEE